MLYITTKSNRDTYTSHRALCESFAPDGGLFAPFHLPVYDASEIAKLQDKTFGEIVADIINLFFSVRITGWDVDCCIGRNAAKLMVMNHKIVVAELWHNVEAKYDNLVCGLYRLVAKDAAESPSKWFCTAVRIAVLFGLYSDLLKLQQGSDHPVFDISVTCGDFTDPMAAWYARKMGLPIGTIICTCEEDSSAWDFIHRGNYHPEENNAFLQAGLAMLVHETLGHEQAAIFADCCNSMQTFTVCNEQLSTLNSGLFCSVAGSSRCESIINSIYRSSHYILDPSAALCYGGLQDYRAKDGGGRITILIADESPLNYASQVERATGLSAHKLNTLINCL